jgi:hypothetical protein
MIKELGRPTGDRIRGQLGNQLGSQLYGIFRFKLWGQLGNRLGDQLGNQLRWILS